MSIILALEITSEFNYVLHYYDGVTEEIHDCQMGVSSSYQEIVDDLIDIYSSYLSIVLIRDPNDTTIQSEFYTHGPLVHFIDEEMFDFLCCLPVPSIIGRKYLILNQSLNTGTLYQCVNISQNEAIWELLKFIKKKGKKQHNDVFIDFEIDPIDFDGVYYEGRFVNSDIQVENYYDFTPISKLIVYGKHLVGDMSAKYIIKPTRTSPTVSFSIKNSLITCPRIVSDYASHTDVMGVDFGTAQCIISTSRNKRIDVIPIDKSSDLWMDSAVSFDEEYPIIGKVALNRLKTKCTTVVYDLKLIHYQCLQKTPKVDFMYPFDIYHYGNGKTEFGVDTVKGYEKVELKKVMSILLEAMKTSVSEYQYTHNRRKMVNKAVITVSNYLTSDGSPDYSTIGDIISAAKLAGIEVIDIIEDTHADLLYYLSSERINKFEISVGTKIAVVDFGSSTGICRVYEIVEQNGKKFAKKLDIFGNTVYSKLMDYRIMELINKQVKEKFEFAPLENEETSYRLLKVTEQAKRSLFIVEKTDIDINELNPKIEGNIQITRNELMISELVNDELDSQISIDVVLLAGSSCRIPFIQQQFKQFFSKAKIIIDGELEIVTAKGAVVHALQVLNKEVEPAISFF